MLLILAPVQVYKNTEQHCWKTSIIMLEWMKSEKEVDYESGKNTQQERKVSLKTEDGRTVH